MKRPLFTLIMVLLLACAVRVSADDGYLLWDMPFGLPRNECASIIEQKTGLVMEEEPPYEENPIMFLRSARGQDASFLGYPISLECWFSDDDALQLVTINIGDKGTNDNFDYSHYLQSAEEKEAFISGGLMEYSNILDKLIDQYGAPTGGYMSVWNNTEKLAERADERAYNYPLRDNELSKDIFLQAISLHEGGVLHTFFYNVSLTLSYASSLDINVYYVNINALSFEEAEGRLSFEREDGEFRAIERNSNPGF